MDFHCLKGKKVLVTGASGLIGRAVVWMLIKNGAHIVANVRNEERARGAFSSLPQDRIEYLVCDVCDLPIEDIGANYVIHGANRTASKQFLEEPVEVIMESVRGTERTLEFAKKNRVTGYVYLSSMEVYGAPAHESKITETAPTDIDTMRSRSSYPESKRICECLCTAYASEYGVPVKVVRLTQTFGPGVSSQDKRVFAEFARCAMAKQDIVLKTKGETKRNYLYTDDAASAILTVLVYGATGEAYNAANEATYCSIYEMARLVSDTFGNGVVRIEEGDAEKLGYAPVAKMNLSAAKLRALGWKPKTDLKTMFSALIADIKDEVLSK